MPAGPKEIAMVVTARALFLRHGIRRVSVEEICREAGVSKRTFYKRFRDRDELALRVVSGLVEESRSRIEATLSADVPIEQKVRELIAVKSGLAAETSVEFYREVMAADSEPGRFARQKQREWDLRVRRFYAEAQARGEIRAEVDLDLLMAMLVRTRSLIEDPEVQRTQPDLSTLVESVLEIFFYGLVPRPAAPAKARARAGKRRKP
jgi:AcrR family transcriptional regulator